MNVRTVQHPWPVALGKKDIAGVLDALQNFSAGAAANALGSEQARAPALARFDLCARFLEPVAA